MPQPQQPPMVRKNALNHFGFIITQNDHLHCYWICWNTWILKHCELLLHFYTEPTIPGWSSTNPRCSAASPAGAAGSDRTGVCVCVGVCLNAYVWEAKITTLSKALIWQHNYSFSAAFSQDAFNQNENLRISYVSSSFAQNSRLCAPQFC